MSSSALLLLAIPLAGCDYVFDLHRPDAPPVDATAVDGDVVSDDAGERTWREPTLLFSSAKSNDDDPSLTGDMLELYFNRDNKIYKSTRPTPSSVWGTPAVVTELDLAGNENGPNVSYDGLTMFFGSNRTVTNVTLGSVDVWMTVRPTRQSPWGTPTHVKELSSTAVDSGASPTSDLLTIVMNSQRNSAPVYNMFVSTRPSDTGLWGPPLPITELNTPGESVNPFLTDDKLTLVFDSTRANGKSDIYIATRAAPNDPFDTPVPITILNTTEDDRDPWLSPDGNTIVFASQRASVNFTLWTSSR